MTQPAPQATQRKDEAIAENCRHWKKGFCDMCGVQSQMMEVSADFHCPYFTEQPAPTPTKEAPAKPESDWMPELRVKQLAAAYRMKEQHSKILECQPTLQEVSWLATQLSATRAALAEAQAKMQSGLSTSGVNVYGDRASIDRVLEWNHALGRCTELEKIIKQERESTRAALEQARAQVASLTEQCERQWNALAKLSQAVGNPAVEGETIEGALVDYVLSRLSATPKDAA